MDLYSDLTAAPEQPVARSVVSAWVPDAEKRRARDAADRIGISLSEFIARALKAANQAVEPMLTGDAAEGRE